MTFIILKRTNEINTSFISRYRGDSLRRMPHRAAHSFYFSNNRPLNYFKNKYEWRGNSAAALPHAAMNDISPSVQHHQRGTESSINEAAHRIKHNAIAN